MQMTSNLREERPLSFMLAWRPREYLRIPLPKVLNSRLMKTLVWNVRRVGHPLFFDHIMELLNIHKPRILILLETKLVRARVENIGRRMPYTHYIYTEPIGYKRGV